MKLNTNIDSDYTLQKSAHTLFVEGSENSLDYKVANQCLVPTEVTVFPLGNASALKNMARVVQHRPKYYFLVDRDHQDDETVEKIWRNFSKNDKPNLLCWKWREIENYFIDPKFLIKSRYLKVTEEKLDKKIKSLLKQNYLVDVANFVIRSVIRSQNADFGSLTINYSNNINSIIDVQKLIEENKYLENYIKNFIKNVTILKIINKFIEKVEIVESEMKNNEYYSDIVMKYVRGKSVLNELINPPTFVVKGINGKNLQGGDCRDRVILEILGKALNLPDDFAKVKKFIEDKINGLYD